MKTLIWVWLMFPTGLCARALGRPSNRSVVSSLVQQGYECIVQALSPHIPHWESQEQGIVCTDEHCEHLGSAMGMTHWQVEMPIGHDGAF